MYDGCVIHVCVDGSNLQSTGLLDSKENDRINVQLNKRILDVLGIWIGKKYYGIKAIVMGTVFIIFIHFSLRS